MMGGEIRIKLMVSVGFLLLTLARVGNVEAQTPATRNLSGVVVTDRNESVAGVSVIVRTSSTEEKVISDADGRFNITAPNESLIVRIEGRNLQQTETIIGINEPSENLLLKAKYVIPPIHESIVIQAETLDPIIDQRNDTVYKNSLFRRDDQLIQTLNAGINVGQHEGGGKSLEVRRFGFNLDHGGVNGGLKILVDNVQQNQGTQGHGQGYLGQLKSLSPELVGDVEILNGPFSAQYGDFSGLGVVQIRLRESFADQLTVRAQAGSFNARRTFLAYSPELHNDRAFIAYDYSYTDGPFLNPGRYRRDNVTGSYAHQLSTNQTLGFKLNLGRNSFFSSGQLPLDLVASGELDRFGFIDKSTGGRAKTGISSLYYKREMKSGGVFKVDGFVGRSLFDLFSNFTFFLNDPVFGDEIQQHDSRLQEGINVQYLSPYKLFGRDGTVTAGANMLANQIQVALLPSIERSPNRLELNRALGLNNPAVLLTRAHANISNVGAYAQQSMNFLRGRLRLESGVRYDEFRFRVREGLNETPTETTSFSGASRDGRFQPKAAVAFSVSERIPLTLYFNYGRGINSQDARGIVQQPSAPRIATTDFYQASAVYNRQRFSVSADWFLIDHSNEQVYIPDDGTFEFQGPSRSTGYELKLVAQINRRLSFSGGVTQVTQAFFRGTSPRVYVDSSPHTVADARLTYSSSRGFYGTWAYRHTSNYRLDGEDATIRASGLDVLDLSIRQRIRSWIDFNLSIDNLTNKRYFETQNYFESVVRPGAPIVARIHGTPGYSIGVTAGFTLHLFGK